MEKVVKASLDRIEEGLAVIYSDEEGEKFHAAVELVPDGKPGMRLRLHIEDREIVQIEPDDDKSENSRDRIRRKYRKLRKRAK